jgi:TolB protein
MTIGFLRRIVFVAMGLILMGPMLCLAQSDADQYEYIDISNPFLRKIPLAVPSFKNVTGSAEEEELSKSSAQLLASSLAFTGYFKILDPGAFLFDPAKDGVLTPQINFANWTVIGAELLITGLFEMTDGRIAMELRLFDTFKNKRILGKKYAGRPDDQRKIIHRFCSEVIQYLTGHKGMFASKIAFVSTGSGNKEIYSCEFDGYGPQQVTRNHDISLFPAWS